MNWSRKARAVLLSLVAAIAIGATPAQAAKVYFGGQEHLRRIEDVDFKGPKGEELYLGYKYSFHSFLLPYSVTDDGYVLGVRGEKAYFALDGANVESFQKRGLLPSPLPPYQLSLLDYAIGHALWILLVVVAALAPLSMLARRRRKRAQPHLNDGLALHQAGHLNRAIESYTRAIEIDPKSAVAFHLRGKAFAGLRYFNLSIADQTRAIRIDPKFADALMDRGMMMRAGGNLDGAISDFSRVIKLTRDATAHFQRGLSYLGKEDYRRAVADFTKVIEANPDQTEAYCQRALAYGKLGDAKRARADHARAVAIANAQPA